MSSGFMSCVGKTDPQTSFILNFSFSSTNLNFNHFVILSQAPTLHELDLVDTEDLISTSNCWKSLYGLS